MALALNEERGTFWLFDCGEATQHQIMRSPLKLSRLEYIFITHLHGDHIYGLPGLLSSRSYHGGTTPLTIFGPAGLARFIESSLQVSGSHLDYELRIEELQEGVIFEDEQFTISCARLEHRIDCYGYRIVEHDLPGRLDRDRLIADGIPPGPIYKQIKMSKEPIAYEGRLLDPKRYVGPDIPGRKLAILGDTRPRRMPCSWRKLWMSWFMKLPLQRLRRSLPGDIITRRLGKPRRSQRKRGREN